METMEIAVKSRKKMNERRINSDTTPDFPVQTPMISMVHVEHSEGRWTTVLEAVKAYVANGAKSEHTVLNSDKFSELHQPALLDRLQDALAKLENIASSDTCDNAIDDEFEFKDAITDNNRELESILHMVKTNVPEILSKVVTLLDEEVEKSNRLELELENTKTQWKNEVSILQEDLTEKTNALAHLTALQTAKKGRDDQDLLLRRVRQSESEVSRLREILSCMK